MKRQKETFTKIKKSRALSKDGATFESSVALGKINLKA